MEGNKVNVQSVLKEIGFTKHNLWSISETEDYYRNGALIWNATNSEWTQGYDYLHQEFSEEMCRQEYLEDKTDACKYTYFEDAYPFILFLTPPSQLSDEFKEFFTVQPSDERTTSANLCVDKDGDYAFWYCSRGVPSKGLPSPEVLLSEKPETPDELAGEVVYLITRSSDFNRNRNLMATGNLTESDFNVWLKDFSSQIMEKVLKENPELARLMESSSPSLTQNPTI